MLQYASTNSKIDNTNYCDKENIGNSQFDNQKKPPTNQKRSTRDTQQQQPQYYSTKDGNTSLESSGQIKFPSNQSRQADANNPQTAYDNIKGSSFNSTSTEEIQSLKKVTASRKAQSKQLPYPDQQASSEYSQDEYHSKQQQKDNTNYIQKQNQQQLLRKDSSANRSSANLATHNSVASS